MIVDMHTHTFPDKIADTALTGMEREIHQNRGYEYFRKLAGTGDALSESTIRNGLDLSVVLPVATRPVQSAGINRFAYENNQKTQKTKVFSFGAIHPDNEDFREILRDVRSMGLKGIKLHPDYQHVCFDDIKYLRIMDYAAELGLLISVHAGEDFGLPHKIHCTPEMIVNVIGSIRPTGLILAHMGGMNLWDGVEEKLIGSDVYLDTAFVLEEQAPHLERNQLVRMIRDHGADRILFGTDSPWVDQKEAVEKIRMLNLTKEEENAILGENAVRLLGITAG